jgi:sensor histidine kinase regulating citrate/malate metabolism
MTLLITGVSIYVNIKSDNEGIDRNLKNQAITISQSLSLRENIFGDGDYISDNDVSSYFVTLEKTLTDVDVISIIGADGIRKYHTNKSLIGTVYDGTVPDFEFGEIGINATNDTGPSGSQRRAYASIYDENGTYLGFIIIAILNRNINYIILKTVITHLCCAMIVIAVAVAMSKYLSHKIKNLLLGYEPDTFSAMFSIRENILESLDEGILAIDDNETVVYINNAAKNMLGITSINSNNRNINKVCPYFSMTKTLQSGKRYFGLSIKPSHGTDILADQIPVMEHGCITGAVCILRDRTEYTKMMEDLSGVRYLVESMRANNHDFVNKLHVILGLIQMEKYSDASEYITNITSIQQTLIRNIMKHIEDPSVAALLIGKYARASELNIQFRLKNGSKLSRSDIFLPSGDLVTIIGNLLDNAMDSMNQKDEMPKELEIGIFTKPHALIIIIDDTGLGISPENRQKIFENGFSTKGENRGTGLFVVRNLIEKYGGSISVESEPDEGTSFTVTLTDEGGKTDV